VVSLSSLAEMDQRKEGKSSHSIEKQAREQAVDQIDSIGLALVGSGKTQAAAAAAAAGPCWKVRDSLIFFRAIDGKG
jgi:hypothetical protein